MKLIGAAFPTLPVAPAMGQLARKSSLGMAPQILGRDRQAGDVLAGCFDAKSAL